MAKLSPKAARVFGEIVKLGREGLSEADLELTMDEIHVAKQTEGMSFDEKIALAKRQQMHLELCVKDIEESLSDLTEEQEERLAIMLDGDM